MTPRKTVKDEGLRREDLLRLLRSDSGLAEVIRAVIQEVLEAEMEETLGAGKSERTEGRRGYRSGYYPRSLVTRLGKIQLRVPQDREGRFSTEIFERYQRSEKALVAALVEMYVQGVSTRKVKAVTEELCGHELSAASVSRATARLDEELELWAKRPLEEPYPYVILDARYEKVREEGAVRSRAVLIAIGIDEQGRRRILSVELADRETEASWKAFLLQLKERGLTGVEFVVSDDHAGLRRAIEQVLSEAVWQRCYVHFLRNALQHFSRKGDDECMTELRWIYDRKSLEEARRDIQAWLTKWGGKYGKFCGWVEENIEQTLSFYRLPVAHHRHMKSTNMLERQNEELKRRTRVVRIFPNPASCLRLIRALAAETDDEWAQGTIYLNMAHRKEQSGEPRKEREKIPDAARAA